MSRYIKGSHLSSLTCLLLLYTLESVKILVDTISYLSWADFYSCIQKKKKKKHLWIWGISTFLLFSFQGHCQCSCQFSFMFNGSCIAIKALHDIKRVPDMITGYTTDCSYIMVSCTRKINDKKNLKNVMKHNLAVEICFFFPRNVSLCKAGARRLLA